MYTCELNKLYFSEENMSNIDELSINAIRFLSADAIQKANSGHPGLPLGCAAIGYELFANNMKHNPKNPDWAGRDRFILSGGHGSMLLYSLLHLTGYGLTIEDLKNFRQMDSKTPGHPEYGYTVGVEATTGPLGQGMGMAVGMAMAEKHMASVFNKPGYPIVDNYTYVLGGDGCMMEGVSSEAFSLAGTLGLDKLIVLYDSNKICIEGSTDNVFAENVNQRMEAFGFQTITVSDGNNIEMIKKAIEMAKADTKRPSFINISTTIGYGCPNVAGTADCHGSPLGDDNIAQMRKDLNWPLEEAFAVPDEVYKNYEERMKKGAESEAEWNVLFEKYAAEYPELKTKWDEYHNGYNLDELFTSEDYSANAEKAEATRSSSGVILNKIKEHMPNLIGGSADLAPSNKTYMKGAGDFGHDSYEGCNLHFGVREQAMGAIVNGIALYGGLRVFASTFFVFSDYLKPMIRVAALMKLPITYVFTHDSIGVGEDGPTHEPIEQLAQFRAMPGVSVMRPCDRRETAAAWKYAMESKNEPVILVLSRQNLAQQDTSSADISKGAYILQDSKNEVPELILMSSGSEIGITVEAADKLRADGVDVRVVSVPCMDLFEKQSKEYKESVLPDACRKRVSVEALSSFGWAKYTGLDGANVAIDRFGESAPAGQLFEHFGFTSENIVNTCKDIL